MTLANRTLREASEGEGVPSVIVRASPGAGKSTLERELMAERASEGQLGNVAFHVPTLALAAEATREAECLGLSAQTIRGRSAPRPDGNGPMCAKAELVEQANRIGLSAKEHFCERKLEDGTVARCPHFEECAYLGQFRVDAACHFLATAYFALPKQPGVDPTLRVLDETFWKSFLWIRDIDPIAFKAPRTFLPTSGAADHADLLKAAAQVVGKLCAGESPLALPYSAGDFTAFAELEHKGQAPASDIRPDQDPLTQKRILEKAAQAHRKVSRFAAVWKVLAEAKRLGLTECERLRLFTDGEKEVLRVMRKQPLRHKEPMLVLDADADTEILAALGCDTRAEHELTLRPRAHVVQVHDHQMSISALLNSESHREGGRRVIAREVLRDRLAKNTGVLVGATRTVVQKFFEDAGHDFSSKSETEINQIMLGTKLHGARWLWLGGRSLGSNRYKDYSAVIVLGRQELPVSTLEDQGRALWGDTHGEPLNFVPMDMKGGQRLPLVELPYEMADGSGMAVKVPCHPDHRIRRVQLQSRELATRQLVERLRLAHAPYRKRVILVSNIPIPGLPVDELISWNELKGDRIDAAISISLVENGFARFKQGEIVENAPGVFDTIDALKGELGEKKSSAHLIRRFKQFAKPLGGKLRLRDCRRPPLDAATNWSVELLLPENAAPGPRG
ncbi:hypothetical protein [Sulfitobacter sp. 15WGC]|uniref:hypothetical protein n=1 Tax=unclassified Sulfitobacter TaxID=196795 RepID=UPI0010ACA97B|nr:hypothetical protein [Sulfitobacter sp. 15WGC]